MSRDLSLEERLADIDFPKVTSEDAKFLLLATGYDASIFGASDDQVAVFNEGYRPLAGGDQLTREVDWGSRESLQQELEKAWDDLVTSAFLFGYTGGEHTRLRVCAPHMVRLVSAVILFNRSARADNADGRLSEKKMMTKLVSLDRIAELTRHVHLFVNQSLDDGDMQKSFGYYLMPPGSKLKKGEKKSRYVMSYSWLQQTLRLVKESLDKETKKLSGAITPDSRAYLCPAEAEAEHEEKALARRAALRV